MGVKQKLTKWLYVFTLDIYHDKIKKLSKPNKETFINAYFRVRGQQLYGSLWMLISFSLVIPTVFIAILNNSSSSWALSFILLLIEVTTFFAVSTLNKNVKEDLDVLMKILEMKEREKLN